MMMIFGIPGPLLFGQLLLGLINGAFYAMLSLGLAIIFGMLNIINFAHGALFMLAAAWTLQIDGHVRVDIFYAQANPRTKALIDLVGAVVFLLPVTVTIGVLSLPYVARSWAIFESSRETSGLPFVYLLKTLIPLFALLLGLQGVAQAIRAWLLLSGPRTAP